MTYKLKLPSYWKIHNAFHVSLLKKFQGTPPTNPIHEDPPKFDEVDEIIQPKLILWHEDNLLQSGKVLRKYLVKFKSYSYDDAQWMMENQLQDCPSIIEMYIATYGLENNQDINI